MACGSLNGDRRVEHQSRDTVEGLLCPDLQKAMRGGCRQRTPFALCGELLPGLGKEVDSGRSNHTSV